jgi:hypothetical protein
MPNDLDRTAAFDAVGRRRSTGAPVAAVLSNASLPRPTPSALDASATPGPVVARRNAARSARFFSPIGTAETRCGCGAGRTRSTPGNPTGSRNGEPYIKVSRRGGIITAVQIATPIHPVRRGQTR